MAIGELGEPPTRGAPLASDGAEQPITSLHQRCRFIVGDPHDVLELGEAIYCGKPVAHPGGSWCREHERVVYTTIEQIREARKAA